jgi:hypothetical protein
VSLLISFLEWMLYAGIHNFEHNENHILIIHAIVKGGKTLTGKKAQIWHKKYRGYANAI